MSRIVTGSSRLVLCVASAVAFSSCAPALHKPLSPADVTALRRTHTRATIPQEEVQIAIVKSTSGDMIAAGGGVCCALVGSMVDKAEDRRRTERAEKWVTPLLEQTSDVDFRKDYWDAVLPTLRALPWLKLGDTELKSAGSDLPEHWLVDNVLLISAAYELTPDGRVLAVFSTVRLWNKPKSKPSYYATHMYLSRAVDAKKGEEALETWSANGAELYRTALQEGIQESMRMIRFDLPDAEQSTRHLTGPVATVRAPSPLTGRQESLAGEILDRGTDRIILRLRNGNLRSLPLADITIRGG